jgi:NAD(P)-dependent dehydrogenase (short-subunit alcohol dehydrogenase family)
VADQRFRDQAAIVTGGAGGIGSAVARRLLQDGARVALVDRDAALLEKARELGSVLTIVADVSQAEDVAAYVGRTLEHFGRIDLLFNNAGIEGRVANIVDSDVADFDKVMAVNVRGVYLGLRLTLGATPAMRRPGRHVGWRHSGHVRERRRGGGRAVDTSVTIPAGASSGGFNISTTQVTVPTTVTISVSGAGVTRSATLTVNP